MATLAELNDPFELHGNMSTEVNAGQVLSYLTALHEKMPFPIPPSLETAQMLMQNAKARASDNEVYRAIRDGRDKINRVLCFSELNNVPLMWSHYCEKHQGVVVGFRARFFEDALRDKWLFKMRYGDLPQIRHIYSGPLSDIENLALAQTKAKYWEYEKEWRLNVSVTELIGGDNPSSKMLFLPIRPTAIDSIFFGLHCPHQIKDNCRLLCRNRPALEAVNFFQARMDGQRPEIIFDSL